MLTPRARASAAEQAAVRGVFSNAALVDLYVKCNSHFPHSLVAMMSTELTPVPLSEKLPAGRSSTT